MPRYFANVARDTARVEPDELPGSIGVLSEPDKPGSIIGIAFGSGWLGGWRTEFRNGKSFSKDLGPGSE